VENFGNRNALQPLKKLLICAINWDGVTSTYCCWFVLN